jgi:hypothetical protein
MGVPSIYDGHTTKVVEADCQLLYEFCTGSLCERKGRRGHWSYGCPCWAKLRGCVLRFSLGRFEVDVSLVTLLFFSMDPYLFPQKSEMQTT